MTKTDNQTQTVGELLEIARKCQLGLDFKFKAFDETFTPATVIGLLERLERAEALNARLRQEAENHAQEARAQKSTVLACYQAVTGSTGEPGDWNSAEPIRQFVARANAAEAALKAAAQYYEEQNAMAQQSDIPERTQEAAEFRLQAAKHIQRRVLDSINSVAPTKTAEA